MPKRAAIFPIISFCAAAVVAGCSADTRPALTERQFAQVVENCDLPDKVVLDSSGRDHPMIILSGSNTTDSQISCIRSEQERIGATADMAN